MDAVDPTVADLTTFPVNHFFGKDEVGGIEIISDDLLVFVTDRNRTINFLLPRQVFKSSIASSKSGTFLHLSHFGFHPSP